MPIRLFISSASLLALVACDVVGPNYTPPTIDISASFAESGNTPAENLIQHEWWTHLNDSKLNTLVQRGMTQNLDVQTALERVRAAEAQLAGTGGATQLTGDASVQTQRSGGDVLPSTTTSSGSANASYVFDLFGGIRRGQEQASSSLQAAQYDAGTVRLTYLSSIVGNYVDARYFQESLELTRQTIASRTQTLSLVRSQRDLGAGTDLAVAQAQAQLDTARASLPGLEIGFHSSVYRIATLLAEPAAPLIADLQRGAAQPQPTGSIRTGIPANLLRNRPDILAAERRYAAALAGVGVAEADLYPALRLSGTVTVASTDSWSFGPRFSLPILGREVLSARREAAISQANQAELAWRAAVLGAVEEVQIAQSTLTRKRREVAGLRDAVASNQRVLALSRAAFEQGQTSVLDLLDAERATAGARMSLAGAVREASAAWVTLQIATGSGWATSLPQTDG